MKHLIKQYDETIYSSAAFDFYFEGLRVGVLDIETTGLNPSRNKFILGGLFDIKTRTMHQIFAESRREEAEALAAFYDLVSDMDMVITYNGKHFDMPFISKRMSVHGIGGGFASVDGPEMQITTNADSPAAQSDAPFLPYNLDLYLVINGHSPIKKFVPNLKQKTVENYMGLWQSRDDEISGAESVELYDMYEKSKDSAAEEKILLHNSDDVLQLTRLIKVLSKCDVHKAMYHLGFPVYADSPGCNDSQNACPLIVNKIKTEKNSLIITGEQTKKAFDYMGFTFGDWPAEINFSRKNMSFSMKLPVIRESGLCIIDLDSAGLDRKDFEKFPSSGSGFLVIEDHNERNFLETNCFIKAFIKSFMSTL